MKKLLLIFLLLFLAACHSFHPHCAIAQDKNIHVVASTFPIYLFAANICAGAEGIQLELLIPSSLGCPHDFALRPADMRKLAQADILLINGAGLEDFLTKALQGLAKQPIIIDASVGVPKLPAAGHADHDHDHDHNHGGINPHTFASPANASIMAANLAVGLAKANPANAELFTRNGDAYAEALGILGEKFENVGKKAPNPNIALEHDALAYLAKNARLQIVALFQNSDSASVIGKLLADLKKEKPALLAGDSQYSDRLLKMIAKETGIAYAQLNPCASGPENPPLDFYQQSMEQNLKILESYFE